MGYPRAEYLSWVARQAQWVQPGPCRGRTAWLSPGQTPAQSLGGGERESPGEWALLTASSPGSIAFPAVHPSLTYFPRKTGEKGGGLTR